MTCRGLQVCNWPRVLNRTAQEANTSMLGASISADGLLSVAVLEHTHILSSIAQWLDKTVGRQDVIVMIIGLVSAVVDNVPLVAASMGMYSLAQYPPDSFLWEFMSYCAGTGGSILIIGSAAGVAAMGLEKIHFFWYARRIGGLALVGYFSGIAVYILQYRLLH